MIYTCRCFQARLWSTRAVRQELPSLWDAGWLLPAQALGATHVFVTKSMQLARNLRQNSLNNCYSEKLNEVITFSMAVVARYALRALAKVNSQLSVCVMLKRRFLQI